MRGAVLLLLLVMLPGCGTRPVVPVSDRSIGQKARAEKRINLKKPRYHIVKKGETLFSIANLYGIDYQRLARWNGAEHDYRIYIGERLRLSPPRRRTRRGHAHHRKRVRQRRYRPSRTRRRSAVAGRVRLKWQWPVRGRLIRRFRRWQPGKKGIDIAGKRGEPIRAAAAGEVLYSGSGLIRYGKLIIIRHGPWYVSTYAHNSRVYVRQGDRVKAGQHIADMGSTGTTRVMLHFEIRYRGRPVDPLRYLPR